MCENAKEKSGMISTFKLNKIELNYTIEYKEYKI